jgi:hypothetical protein
MVENNFHLTKKLLVIFFEKGLILSSYDSCIINTGLLPIEEIEKGFKEVKKIRQGKLPKICLKYALRD